MAANVQLNKPVQEYKVPTELVDLSSKGLIYPEDSLLSQGVIELKYPTAAEEDILNSQKLIQKGIVIDTFLKSIIVTPIPFGDISIGDKNALIIASRILLYGSKYNTEVECKSCSHKQNVAFDLSKIDDKEIDESILNRENVYSFTLPKSKLEVTFKLLTQKDEEEIERQIKMHKALSSKTQKNQDIDKTLTIRLKQMILSIGSFTERKDINHFIDSGQMLSVDSKELRDYANSIQPDINRNVSFVCEDCGTENNIKLPLSVSFFWPTSDLA